MPTASVVLQLTHCEQIWVKVALSLREQEYLFLGLHEKQSNSVPYLTYADAFSPKIEPLDEEAAKAFQEAEIEEKAEAAAEGREYVCDWGGFVVDGAHQGFRQMKTPDRGIIVSGLEGRVDLDSAAEGIVWAAILTVVLLLGGDVAQVAMPRWKMVSCNIE